MQKIGVILLNLGTPDSYQVSDLKKYLREFLMDKYTIDIPWLARWFLVNAIIVPRRAANSAHAYQTVWTKNGSPLKYWTEAQADELQKQLGSNYIVAAAMKIGSPDIESALIKLQHCDEIRVLAMYPQYAEATTRTSNEKVEKIASKLDLASKLKYLEPFYSNSEYISALVNLYSSSLNDFKPDHVLFSFHGLPVSQIKKMYPEHCLMSSECCNKITTENKNCYRAQCFMSAKLVAQSLQSNFNIQLNTSVAFQSRLGRAEWIAPYTEEEIRRFASSGIRKLAVSSLSFVTDCLENVEEIGMRMKEVFLQSGGEEFLLLPSLNCDPGFIQFLTDFVS